MFFWPLRVYLEDTDAGGIVFYANYLKFMERARTEWLLQAGVSLQQLADDSVQCVVRSLQIDYQQPAQLGQQLQVGTAVKEIRRASWTLHQDVRRNSTLICEATVRLACVHASSLKPLPLPLVLLNVLQKEIC